jgi:hypothetical protein
MHVVVDSTPTQKVTFPPSGLSEFQQHASYVLVCYNQFLVMLVIRCPVRKGCCCGLSRVALPDPMVFQPRLNNFKSLMPTPRMRPLNFFNLFNLMMCSKANSIRASLPCQIASNALAFRVQ